MKLTTTTPKTATTSDLKIFLKWVMRRFEDKSKTAVRIIVNTWMQRTSELEAVTKIASRLHVHLYTAEVLARRMAEQLQNLFREWLGTNNRVIGYSFANFHCGDINWVGMRRNRILI